MNDHSFIAPSAAHRWIHCTGSPHLLALSPRKSAGEAAERGTIIHAAAASLERGDLTDTEWSWVQAYRKLIPEGAFIEQRAGSAVHPLHFGTIDAYWRDDKGLSILDLKTGKWPVSAAENWQLIGYAAELVFPVEGTIRLGIFQPTVSMKPQWWVVTDEQLRPYINMYTNRANEVFDAPKLTPGEQCKFCSKPACDNIRRVNAPSATDW